MKSFSKKFIIPFLFLSIVGVLLYGVVTKLVATHTESLRAELESRIELQTKRVVTVADVTKQNGADATVAQVVKDCSADKRKKFDTLLDKLSSTIEPFELTELTGLFYQCGNFYAQQRSLMSLVLTREVTVLADTISMANLLQFASTTRQFDLQKWQEIAKDEAKIAQFFTELVDLQGSIIVALVSGKTANSPEVTDALADVGKVRGQMVVLSTQIKDHRAALVGI